MGHCVKNYANQPYSFQGILKLSDNEVIFGKLDQYHFFFGPDKHDKLYVRDEQFLTYKDLITTMESMLERISKLEEK